MPSRSAARHSSGTSPTGSAAAASSSRRDCRGKGCHLAQEALLEAVHQRRGTGGAGGCRTPARPPTALAAARGGRAGCRGSRPGCGPGPGGRGYRAPPSPGALAASRLLSPRTTSSGSPVRPGLLVGLADGEDHGHGLGRAAGGRRTPASAPTPGPATGRRPRRRSAAAPRRPRLSRVSTARPTRKRSGCAARPQPEGRAEGVALRARAASSSRSRYGTAQLVQAGEGELHLRLDAGRPADPASRRAVEEELEQRGLADPGLAAQHQDLAAARLHGGDEAGQRLALASSSQHHRPGSGSGHAPTAPPGLARQSCTGQSARQRGAARLSL